MSSFKKLFYFIFFVLDTVFSIPGWPRMFHYILSAGIVAMDTTHRAVSLILQD